MPTLTLLGDSVIDNAPYLGAGEPDVPAQIRGALPGWTVAMYAVDGADAKAVRMRVPEAPAAGPVFLSAGGNDALGHRHLLPAPTKLTFAQALLTVRLARETFRADFATLLDALAGRPILIATIYNPRFTGEDAPLQDAAEAGLSAFNDVIQQEALARALPVLDLRRLMSEPEDYANPIEPSAIGGAKIAARVAAWATKLPASASSPTPA